MEAEILEAGAGLPLVEWSPVDTELAARLDDTDGATTEVRQCRWG